MFSKKSCQQMLLVLIILTQSWLLVSCGGGSDVQIDLSGAQALLLGAPGSNSSSLSSDFEIGALSADDAVSNLMKLLEDGTLAPVVKENPLIIVTSLHLSPTGEVYVQFSGSVLVHGESCKLVMVADDGSLACVIDDYGRLSYFDQEGNAYMGVRIPRASNPAAEPSGSFFELLKWNRSERSLSTLVTQDKLVEIKLAFDTDPPEFRQLPDGSLILLGNLIGTTGRLFRYYPNNEALETLTDALVEATPSDFLATGAVFYVDAFNLLDGNLYISAGDNFYKGFVGGNGQLTFQFLGKPINYQRADYHKLVRSSAGNVYIINYFAKRVHRIEPNVAQIELPEGVDKIEINEDFVYASGVSLNGEFFFIRKNLDNGEEIDLLHGKDLLVQQFDISSNGDIYFGAVDLTTTTRALYRYITATGELIEVSSLPYDLSNLIVLSGSI